MEEAHDLSSRPEAGVRGPSPGSSGFCRTLSIGRSNYYRGRRGRTDPDLELRIGSTSWRFLGPSTVTVP